jgi:drug/metabolite transporter (DMT)-like permease
MNEVLDKFILAKRLPDAYSFNVLTMVYDLIPLALILAFVPVVVAWPWILIAFFTGLLIVPILLLYNFAMIREEASRVGALTNIYPAFVAVLAFAFLREDVSSSKYVGLLILVVGAVLISHRWSKASNRLVMSPALALILAYGFLWAINLTLSKFALGFIDYWSFYAWSLVGSFIGGVSMLASRRVRNGFKSVTKTGRNRTLLYVLLTSSVFYVGDLSAVVAMWSGAAVSLVSALTATEPLFILTFASLISAFKPYAFKEPLDKTTLVTKAIAVTLIALGVYLVTV